MFEQIPPEVRAAGPGIAGSFLAMFFLRRPALHMAGMLVGGCVLAYYGTAWVAYTLDMERADGLVGFLLGLFGMALISKVYDTIEAIEPAKLWQAALAKFRQVLGVKDEQ